MIRLLAALLMASTALHAAEAQATEASAIQEPMPNISWRTRYTLGPGDILDLGLHGRPELSRGRVFVRPDGTIGYLQAEGVRASGRTIDELKAALEVELSRHHTLPRVIITPVELRSKRYVILGKVVDKGVFSLEHRMTLLEATAKARGIETGLFEGNTVELADLPRSFVSRGGKRLPVDFEKLFFEGDFSQNIEIEPGDFIFFASAISNDVFILGEVAQPGVFGFTPRLTVVGSIASRGGFTVDAYRGRVLVVRGSLEKPETIVVDVARVLAGAEPDVLLQPKDIVYVSKRPWLLAEELLDNAITAFLGGMTSTWADRNISPELPEGSLPQIKK